MTTQLQAAKLGNITEQMKYVAQKEGVQPETLRSEVEQGRLVIPANKIHLATNLQPVGIGRLLTTKINANIGTSSVRSSLEGELEKMKIAIELGADTIMDLSTGGRVDVIREVLLAECTVPFGTVPIYEVIIDRDVEDITCELILETVEKQARQGVDFFTIHAGVLKKHLPLIEKRTSGIVSRGGALLAKWMLYHDRENPMYEMFDELSDIMRQYDVCFSLGDALRPGCIADATDQAQMAELHTLGELTQRAQASGCQVMVEGPGHIPFDQIRYNVDIQQEICNGAPFYVLGPLVTDIAPGYDHITSAIGGAAAAYYGASFLCYVTPREHLGLPDAEDVRRGVIASKIAAHAADLARGLSSAVQRDESLSLARANLDWQKHLTEALDPQTARRMYQEACKEIKGIELPSADYCSMCGQKWCSLRINKEIRRVLSAEKTEKQPT